MTSTHTDFQSAIDHELDQYRTTIQDFVQDQSTLLDNKLDFIGSTYSIQDLLSADIDGDSSAGLDEAMNGAVDQVKTWIDDMIANLDSSLQPDLAQVAQAIDGQTVSWGDVDLLVSAGAADAENLHLALTLRHDLTTPDERISSDFLFDSLDRLQVERVDRKAPSSTPTAPDYGWTLGGAAELLFAGDVKITKTTAPFGGATTFTASSTTDHLSASFEAGIDEAATEKLRIGFLELQETVEATHADPDIQFRAELTAVDNGVVTGSPQLVTSENVDLEVEVTSRVGGLNDTYKITRGADQKWHFEALESALKGFRAVNASAIVGQLQTLQQELGALTRSPVLENIDAGVVKEKIGQVADYVRVIQDALFGVEGSPANGSSLANFDPVTGQLKTVMFRSLQELQTKLSGLGILANPIRFEDGVLELDLGLGERDFLDREVDASFADQLQTALASLQSSSSFHLSGTGKLSFTLGIDLTGGTPLDATTDLGSLREALASHRNIETQRQNNAVLQAGSAIPVQGILTGDLAFDIIGIGSSPIRISLAASATSNNAEIQDLVDDLNVLLDGAFPNHATSGPYVKALANHEGGISLVGSQAFRVKPAQDAATGASNQGMLSELRLPLEGAGKDGALTAPIVEADSFMTHYGKPLAASQLEFIVTAGTISYSVTVPNPDRDAAETPEGFLKRLNSGLKVASESGPFSGVTDLGAKLGLQAFLTQDGHLAFRSSSALSTDKAFHPFTIKQSSFLGFSSDTSSQFRMDGRPLLSLGRLSSDLNVDFDLGAQYGEVSLFLNKTTTRNNTSIAQLLDQIKTSMDGTIVGTSGKRLGQLLEASYVGQRLTFQAVEAYDATDDSTLGSFTIKASSSNLSGIGFADATAKSSSFDDFVIHFRDGSSASINLHERTLSDGTRVAITDATTVDETLLEISRQVQAQTGSFKLNLEMKGDHLLLLDQSTVGNGRLQVSSLPGSSAAQLLGIEGVGDWYVTENEIITLELPVGTAAAVGDLVTVQGYSYSVKGVLSPADAAAKGFTLTGVGIEIQSARNSSLSVNDQVFVHFGAGPVIASTVTHTALEQPWMALEGGVVTGLNLADRFYVRDLEAVTELGLEVQDKHLSDTTVVLTIPKTSATGVQVGTEIHLEGRKYAVLATSTPSGSTTTDITISASAAVVTKAAGEAIVLTIADGTAEIAGTIKSKTTDPIEVRGRHTIALDVTGTAELAKISALAVGSMIKVNGQYVRVTALDTAVGTASAPVTRVTFRASHELVGNAVGAALGFEFTTYPATGAPVTATVAAKVQASAVDPETVVDGARTVTVHVAGSSTDYHFAVGKSFKVVGGETFRISSLEGDATAGWDITFRTGDKAFSSDKGDALSFTIGLLPTTGSATVTKIDGKRQVILEVNASDDIGVEDSGQFLTYGGVRYRVVRVDVDKELNAQGLPVLRDENLNVIGYDSAGNPLSGGGTERAIAKYVVLETDYEGFTLGAGDSVVGDVSAEGVQLSGAIGPLGIHLLGSGSIGRRIEFGIEGKLTVGDLLDTVLLRDPASGLIYDEVKDDEGWKKVFRPATATTEAGWSSAVPEHGDASVHVAITDRTGHTDEKLEFQVIGEGLKAQSRLADLSVWFDPDSGLPDSTFSTDGISGAMDFSDLASKLDNLTVDGLLDALDEALSQISRFTGDDAFQTEIPGTGKSIGDLLDVVQEVRDVVMDLRNDGGAGTIETIEHRIEKLLGLQDDEFELSLVEEAAPAAVATTLGVGDTGASLTPATSKVLRFDFHMARRIHDKSSFTFDDNGTFSVGGGAELYTEGWLDANLSFGVVLPSAVGDTAAVEIYDGSGAKASFDVSGENLKFNLGISGLGALSKLLQVEGKNGARSYLAIHGEIGVFQKPDTTATSGSSLDVSSTFNIGGNLPVFIAGTSMGEAKLGIWHENTTSDPLDDLSAYDGTDTTKGVITDLGAFQNFFVKTFKNEFEGVAPSDPPAQTEPGLDPTAKRDIADNAIVLDISPVVAAIEPYLNGDFNFFEMIKLGVDGLDMALESLQVAADDALTGFDVPVLSTALEGGADFLSELRLKLVEPFREFIHEADVLDAKAIADWLVQKLGPSGLNVLQDWQDAKDPSHAVGGASRNWGAYLNATDLKFSSQDIPGATLPAGGLATADVAYLSKGNKAEWGFTLGGTYVVGDDFALDLGIPGLGLETTGGVGASVKWTLNLGFGISQEKGFYLILPSGDELVLDAEAHVDNETSLMGRLGFLRLSVEGAGTDNAVGASLKLGLDLDNKKTDLAEGIGIGDLAYFQPDLTYEAQANADLLLRLGIGDDVGSGAPQFPNIFAEFEFAWGLDNLSNVDATTGDHKLFDGDAFFESIKKAGFSTVSFDMGGYISLVLKPVLDRINAVVEPVRPLVDFLTSPIPVLSDISGQPITMLDLAKLIDKDLDVGMINSIRDLLDLIDLVNDYSGGASVALPLGSFWFVEEAPAGSASPTTNAQAKRFLVSGAVGSAAVDILSVGNKLAGTNVDAVINGLAAELKKGVAGSFFSSVENRTSGMTKPKGASQSAWAFPIIQHPETIFGLLLGKDVDLVTYDMAPLDFEFTWSQYFPIIGPIGARISVTLGADIDLAFGYDTQGIRRFVESDYSNWLALVDGFYVSDLEMVDGQPKGKDIPEVSLHGGVSAAAELNLGIASGGVGGGLGVQVDFNLNDPDHDGKVRLYEMWENVANEWENSDGLAKAKAPLAVFDISGRIYAEFFAYVDTWFWSERWQIVDPIEIMTFEVPFQRAPKLAHEDDTKVAGGNVEDVVLNVGPNAEGRLNGDLVDGNETVDVHVSGNAVQVTSRSLGAAKSQSYTVGAGGRLYIDGGAGNDTIRIDGDANFDIEILGGAGADTIDLSGLYTSGQVVVTGGAGSDTIKGSKANDILVGDDARFRRDANRKVLSIDARIAGEGQGSDTIVAGTGDDIVIGGGGSDNLAGGSSDDILPTSLDAKASTKTDKDVVLGDAGRVVLASAAQAGETGIVRKVNGADWIVARAELEAGGGNDTILGGADDDLLLGGTGDDRIDGGAGKDDIFGHRGNDTLVGGSGNDHIEGGDGIDIAFGDVLASTLNLETVFPDKHFSPDLASRSVAAIRVAGVASETTGTGDDVILGGQGSDILFGDDGAKGGTGGADIISGGLDNDLISGDAGDDDVSGNYGEDVVYGGLGSDLVSGGEGNDILFGDEGLRGFAPGATGAQIATGETRTFGVNIADNFKIKTDTTSGAVGGNDTIDAGLGSDWVDGQGGSDRVQVVFRGGDQHSVVNVRDTGTGTDVDSVNVLGTFGDDDILVRASNNAVKLGVVALLPEDATKPDDGFPVKTELERVNFWESTEKLVVDASMGDDRVRIDGTMAETIVQGGSGDDKIVVGQMFHSGRTGTEANGVTPADPFIGASDSFATDATTKGYLSQGASGNRPVTVQGGFGNDQITILRNTATVSAFGEEGNDTFQAQSFRRPDDTLLLNAPINIDGGAGTDSYAVAGTDGDDKFFITKDGILTEGVSANVTGVESSAAEAGAGDDTFYVLGTKEGTDTVLHGGLGADTVVQGGLAESVPLQSLDLRGHSGLIEHEVVTDDAAYSKVAAKSLQVNVIDDDLGHDQGTGDAVVLFVNAAGTAIVDPAASLQESATAPTAATYWLKPSGVPASDLDVTISAPPVPQEILQAGGRAVLLSSDDGATWSESVTVRFAAGSTAVKGIRVWVPSDYIKQGDRSVFLNHAAVKVSGSTTTPLAAMRSVAFAIVDRTAAVEADPLVFAREYVVPASTTGSFDLDIPTGSVPVANLKIYWANGAEIPAASIDASGATLKVSGGLAAGGRLVAHWSASSLVLEGRNSVDLAYAQAADGASLQLTLDGKVLKRHGVAYTGSGTLHPDLDWILDGRKILFVSKATGRVVGAQGTLSVSGASPITGEVLSTTPPTVPGPSSVPDVVIDTVDGSLDVVEGTDGIKDTYTVRLTTAPTSDVTVRVKVPETVWGAGAGQKSRQVTVSDGTNSSTNGVLDLVFHAGETKTYTITVTAVNDSEQELDEFSFVAARPETLDDLDGAVWAEGDGGSSDFSAIDPLMIRHSDKGEFAFKSETNNYDDLHAGSLRSGYLLDATKSELDAALAKVILGGTAHPTYADLASGQWAVMFTSGVVETGVLAQVKTIPGSSASPTLGLDRTLTLTGDGHVTWRLVKVSKSLFVSEAEQVDRVFVNDRDATVARTGESLTRPTLPATPSDVERSFLTRLDAQRFNAGEIAAKGLNWGDFELAEVNLGHGIDTLDIASAQDRDDGFQVVTIVNTGEGNDQIKVSSYKKAAATTVVAGTLDSESSTSAGAKKFYAKVSMTLPAGFDLSKIGTYWLDLTDSVGGVERRSILSAEISGSFINFRIDRAFTGAVRNNVVRLVDVAKGTDGVLSVNAQDGDDTIKAYDATKPNAVTGPLVVFGGLGNDSIEVGSSGTVFGDRGQVVYLNETTGAPVTLLGTVEVYEKPDGTLVPILEGTVVPANAVRRFHTDDTTPLTTAEHQTDGVRRNPVLYRTVQDDVGGNDTIHIVGSDNVVFGGNNAVANDVLGVDTITIDGGQNIVLGDGGRIVQVPLEAGKSLVWGDGAPARIDSVETTSDTLGARDVITAGNGVNGNVMMGGQGGDSIVSGNGNDIILGDGGRVKYQVSQTDATKALRSRIETKSDPIGASDTIDAGDGDNIVFGGAASDGQVWAGSGRDIMVGDGGFVSYDKTETLDRVSNAGQTVEGGNDTIHAGIGENIVFGGLGDDLIVAGVVRGATDYRTATSDDKDEVVGDNGVRTFLGTDDPSVLAGTTLSFNFQGQAQTGIAANKFAGAAGYRATNWNNIAGPLTGIGASTFGNDPKEILLNAQGERMQGLELSYGGKENHRTDSIELNAYQQENYDAAAIDAGKPDSADGWLFAGGVRTSGPNDQLGNKLEVEMDGLSEYFSSYSVVVYIDAPNNVSGLITNDTGESIRRVGISEGKGVNGALVEGDKYYIDDSADPNNPAFHNFRGTYLKADQKNLTDPRTAKGKWANYVVFDNITADRFVVTIADAIKNTNGLDIPSIAGIQIVGKYNRQNTLASSGTELGGTDTISTSGGDDLVIGGAGADKIATFGDVRRGEDDFDTVIGDDGKVVLMDHALRPTAEPVFATSTSYASSLDLSKTSFDDVVVTGNGNDVVIGGEGQDRVDTERHDDLAAGLASAVFAAGEAVPEALQGGANPLAGNLAKLGNWNTDGLRVTSVNFTYTGRDSSIIDADLNVTSGQIAGAVAAANWNNLIVRDDLSVPLTINQAIKDSNGTTVNGVTFGIQTRNVQNNTQLSFAMGDHYFGHNEIDADSDNARLFESYLWSQKQDQIEVSIAGLNAVNNGGAFDVYVYIDGDDQRTAGDDYAFRVDGNGVQYFLNDWQGNTFNGEFRRVDVKTAQAPNTGVTPDGRMVGNYVVFKNVTGSNFSLKIRNHWYNDQAPLSMPSLAGLQIVAGSQAVRDNLALNGDYDKDVVVGDNGKVRFNLDIPYGVNDDVAAAQNKAVEVESIATTQKAGIQGDVIATGRNQDLVVGGNGADRIDTGVGDDVVLGDNGRVLLNDYNPIGVRTPTNVAILDNQLQDNAAYIGGMNFNAGSFQAEALPGVKLATSTGGADLIEAGADNDLVYGQEGDDLLVGNEGKDDILRGGAGTNQIKDQAGAYASQSAFQSDMAGLLALLDNAGKSNLNAFVANDYGQTVSLGALATAVVVPPTDPTPPTTTEIALPSNTDVVVNFAAGQEVVLVATDWPGKGNAYWKPDIILALNGNGMTLPALAISVDGSTMAPLTTSGGQSYLPVPQIPDTPPDGLTYRIRVKALQAASVKLKLTNA